MFEASLSEKFQRIFDLKKVSYDEPGDSNEQECLFIEVENSMNSIKDGAAIARVTGNAVVFSTHFKMPFGYLSKRIYQADPDDTKDLFFFDVETNTKLFQGVVRRGFGFVYFFNSQYDPPAGTITSIELGETE